jgi:NADH dehydrogenase (ubiquinone) Fe-S protein 6|tara:strand:- start:137 stop:340 length:204 start_codon:yes stop_codon:yes gene_type:complete
MHRSNAAELIEQVPVIDVHGSVAVCDGGGGALGHPLEFIQLNMVTEGTINECKYCSLRFRSTGGGGH